MTRSKSSTLYKFFVVLSYLWFDSTFAFVGLNRHRSRSSLLSNVGINLIMSGEREEEELATPFNIMESSSNDGRASSNMPSHWPSEEEGSLIVSPSQHNSSLSSELDFDDTAWSIYSNTFFVTGGLFYLMATSWDYVIFSPSPGISIDDALNLQRRILYEFLWFMGPMTYMLNSIIDVRWALKVRRRDERRKNLEKMLVEIREGRQTTRAASDDTASSSLQIDPSSTKLATPKKRFQKVRVGTKTLLRRMRKHMGHRRELAAATTFGIAAALSVSGAICYLVSTDGEFSFVIHSARNGGNEGWAVDIDSNDLAWTARNLEWASIHMYLVSALFALWRNPFRKSCGSDSAGSVKEIEQGSWSLALIRVKILQPFNNVESMETIGDIFFGVASVADVFLEDSTLDDNILWWPIVSALLWTLDALFYLRGDFVTLFLKKEVLSSMEDTEDVQLSTSVVELRKVNEEDTQIWDYPVERKGSNKIILS